MTVGPVAYSNSQLLGLSDSRRAMLAHLTAFGLAVSDSSTMELGAPVLEEWRQDRLIEILAAELTLEQSQVTDAVLEARYMTDPAWELTVRHILFFSERWRDSAHRAAALEKAERALESLRAGADFAETAAALSEEPGAEGRQGLLQPGRDGSWVPEFWGAGLALQPGEISPVTETQYGFHILRLEDRQVIPFAEGRSAIARAVATEVDDPDLVLATWLETERMVAPSEHRQAALDEAAARGLSVPEGEVAELERSWDDLTYRWAATLGFRYGRSPEQVAQDAFTALANASQNVEITRNEVASRADILEARYPVGVPNGSSN